MQQFWIRLYYLNKLAIQRSVRQFRKKTWTDLQLKHTKFYTDLKKTNKSANDVTKLTINDYIMLHRKTTKELKNWTKTADHEGIQCSWPYRQEHLNFFSWRDCTLPCNCTGNQSCLLSQFASKLLHSINLETYFEVCKKQVTCFN